MVKRNLGLISFMILMAAHWLEHAFQAYQVWVLHMNRACAMGMLGMKYPWLIQTESLHFAFAVFTTVGIALLYQRYIGWSFKLWNLALGISIWHLFEHTLLFYQAVSGHYMFGMHHPTSILQLGFPRIELHLFYNTIVTIPLVIGSILNQRPTKDCACKTCRIDSLNVNMRRA